MKLFLFFMLISLNVFALQEIPLINPNSSEHLNVTSPIGIPSYSKSQAGKVSSKVVNKDLFNSAIFIIGGDRQSREWVNAHKKELQAMQAVGFITNIDSFEEIIALQEETQLPLLPVNIDPLMDLIDEIHYPLIISKGRLWQ